MPRPLANDLVDRLLAARDQRIAELEAALDKYGQHEPGCGARDYSGWGCTIAHAPEDIRFLLDEVRRLRGQVDPGWRPASEPPDTSRYVLVPEREIGSQV